MATSFGLFLASNQSQLAERKHVARYWPINTAATAVPLSAHPFPFVITTKLAAAILGGGLFGGGVLRAQYCPCASFRIFSLSGWTHSEYTYLLTYSINRTDNMQVCGGGPERLRVGIIGPRDQRARDFRYAHVRRQCAVHRRRTDPLLVQFVARRVSLQRRLRRHRFRSHISFLLDRQRYGNQQRLFVAQLTSELIE